MHEDLLLRTQLGDHLLENLSLNDPFTPAIALQVLSLQRSRKKTLLKKKRGLPGFDHRRCGMLGAQRREQRHIQQTDLRSGSRVRSLSPEAKVHT